jgi:tetratricopeptide (TPR) repeat protein
MRLRLAEVLDDKNGFAASEGLHHEALDAYRGAFSPGDTNITHPLHNLAIGLRGQGRFAEAVPFFREIYEIHRRAMPADHRAIGESAANLANVLISVRRYADAEPLAREAIVEHGLAVPCDEWALAWARLELGRVLLAMGKFPEAESELLAAEHFLASTSDFRLGPVALAALYTAWDQAEPGNGYDAKAGEWSRKLIGTFVRLEEASIPPLVIRPNDQTTDRSSHTSTNSRALPTTDSKP